MRWASLAIFFLDSGLGEVCFGDAWNLPYQCIGTGPFLTRMHACALLDRHLRTTQFPPPPPPGVSVQGLLTAVGRLSGTRACCARVRVSKTQGGSHVGSTRPWQLRSEVETGATPPLVSAP